MYKCKGYHYSFSENKQKHFMIVVIEIVSKNDFSQNSKLSSTRNGALKYSSSTINDQIIISIYFAIFPIKMTCAYNIVVQNKKYFETFDL